MTTTALDIERDNRECPGSYTSVELPDVTWPACDTAPCPDCGNTVEIEWDGSTDFGASVIYLAHDRGAQDA